MRRLLSVIFIIILFTRPAISQEVRLRVVNKPLNTVINTLGLEVSFDDIALSRYRVTVSRTFDSSEKALYALLKGKPFRIEKTNQVYIVVPTEKYMKRVNTYLPTEKVAKNTVFSGKITNSRLGSVLAFATVTLLDGNGKPLIACISDEEGAFAVDCPDQARRIKISYVGYQTLLQDIPSLSIRTHSFMLQPEVVALDEAIVSEKEIKHQLNKTTYEITPDMIPGTSNAEDLIDRIPGVYFDRMTHSIRVNDNKEVLLLVDGVQKTESYIRNLSPARIHSVEVINESSGRFVSDGYTAIVNLRLKSDYRGYDIYTSYYSSLTLRKQEGDNHKLSDKLDLGVNYVHKNFSFYTSFTRNIENRQLPVFKELTYRGIRLESEGISHSSPNHGYNARSSSFSAGMNLNVAPGHVVGLQTDFISDSIHATQAFELRRTEIETLEQRDTKDSAKDETSSRTFVGTLFYQGQWSSRLQIYGDFSYNHYVNDMNNEYRLRDIQEQVSGNNYNEYKRHTLLNLEGQYLLSDRLSLHGGYAHSWRKYASESSQGVGFLDYREFRDKYFTYFSVYPSKRIQWKIGVAYEHVRTYNREEKLVYSRLLPYVQANFNVHKAVNVNASYSTTQFYPGLFQLSPMSLVIDNYLSQVGNPELKSALHHICAIRVSLWDKLILSPSFIYTKDGISESYIQREFKLYRTFYNTDMKEFRLQSTYDQSIGRYFRWSSQLIYYRSSVASTDAGNNPQGWLADMQLNYYHPKLAFGFQLGYHRNMKKMLLIQGYQMVDRDYWEVALNKEFWKKRIVMSCSYIPPLALGVNYEQRRKLNSSLYSENSKLNLKPYNNLLLFKLSFRFNHDSSKPMERRNGVKQDEREKPTVEF